MAEPLNAHTIGRIFDGLVVEADKKTRTALSLLARELEKRTKEQLALTTHPRRERTSASAGGPPALVSGTLRRSITHTPVAPAGFAGWRTKVGTHVGMYPPYGGRRRTPSSKYGFYLETGLRNGATYPFLTTSWAWMSRNRTAAVLEAVYGHGWPRFTR